MKSKEKREAEIFIITCTVLVVGSIVLASILL